MTSISVFIADHLSPKARSRMLARAAGEVIAKAKTAKDEADGIKGPPPRITVDGRRGAPLDTVKPDGEIVASFNTASDIVKWIVTELETHSPVKTGAYERGHAAFVDGKPYVDGQDLSEAREIVILNPLPYARKIERGQGSAGADGVYQAVAVIASRRYGNFATAKFTYHAVRDGQIEAYTASGVLREAMARTTGGYKKQIRRKVAAQQREQRDRRVPAIVLRLR